MGLEFEGRIKISGHLEISPGGGAACENLDIDVGTGQSANYYFHAPSGSDIKSKAFGVGAYATFGLGLDITTLHGANIVYLGVECTPDTTDANALFIIVLEGSLPQTFFESVSLPENYLGFEAPRYTASADFYGPDGLGNTVWYWEFSSSSGAPWFGNSSSYTLQLAIDCPEHVYVQWEYPILNGDTFARNIAYDGACEVSSTPLTLVNTGEKNITAINAASSDDVAMTIVSINPSLPSTAGLIEFTLELTATTCPFSEINTIPLVIDYDGGSITITVECPPNA